MRKQPSTILKQPSIILIPPRIILIVLRMILTVATAYYIDSNACIISMTSSYNIGIAPQIMVEMRRIMLKH
jgi:hypothetical protein